MKAKEKVLITEITSAIEQTMYPAWNQPKAIIDAIEKSAGKLAHKLIRNEKKEAKILAKATRKSRSGKVEMSE